MKIRISKTTGREFIKFKVPHSILGGIKYDGSNRAQKMQQLRTLLDSKVKEFVGVPISHLVVPSDTANLTFAVQEFKASDGKVALVYSSGEDSHGFYIVVTKG